MREEAGSPQGRGGGIQWGKVEVGATQRRPRQHILLKVQGCPACCGLYAREKEARGEHGGNVVNTRVACKKL